MIESRLSRLSRPPEVQRAKVAIKCNLVHFRAILGLQWIRQPFFHIIHHSNLHPHLVPQRRRRRTLGRACHSSLDCWNVFRLAIPPNPRPKTIPTYIFTTIVNKKVLVYDLKFSTGLKRNQEESNPPNLEPELEEEKVEEEEEATTQELEEAQVMTADNRTIKELSTLGLDNAVPLCIQYPTVAQGKTKEFELKSSLLHHIPKYHGLSMEDPNKHLKEFVVVCSSMTPVNVDGSILKMKAFPFSLLENAKDWLYELAPGTPTSWESMKRAFLEKFFPTSRVIERPKVQENTICGLCSIQGHQSEKCPQLIENGGWESANVIGFQGQNQPKYDPYSNTYNSGWRDHPNMKQREFQQPQQQGGFRPPPPGMFPRPYALTQLQPQSAQPKSGSSMDNDQIVQLLTIVVQGMQNQAKKVDEMEKHMGQMAEFMGQFREQGRLPSSMVVNPNGGFESPKAITLRNGKEVGTKPQVSKSSQKKDVKLQFEEEEQDKATARIEQSLPQPLHPLIRPIRARFMQSKKEESDKDILEMFRKVQVNIPLLDAIKQVSKYAKFLKELCTTKKWILNKEVVRVNQLIFLDDFYVLEMEDSDCSPPLPILLGKPFMKTARTKIDVFKGTLTMKFDGDVIDFNIFEAMRYPSDDHSCFSIDVIDSLAHQYLEDLNEDAFEITIMKGMGPKNEGA
ncbi:unnamed protein product [Malus baccata var. baccata]